MKAQILDSSVNGALALEMDHHSSDTRPSLVQRNSSCSGRESRVKLKDLSDEHLRTGCPRSVSFPESLRDLNVWRLVVLVKMEKVLLLKYGRPPVNTSIHNHNWHGHFDLQTSTLVEPQLLDSSFPWELSILGTLRQLTVNFPNPHFCSEDLGLILRTSPELVNVSVLVHERDGHQVNGFIQDRAGLNFSHELTLPERMKDHLQG